MGTNEQKADQDRATEPMPRNWRPALGLLLFLLMVTVGIAVASVIVDRAIYG